MSNRLFKVDKLDSSTFKDSSISLLNYYIVPPFTTLDCKQGYWQDRKREWKRLIGDSSLTRNEKDTGKLFNTDSMGAHNNISGNTSNFDPVLAELMLRWFCVPNGKVLDPFGGEQTKGVVAGTLGYEYYGVEIRQQQVALNLDMTKNYPNVHYIHGDSMNIDNLIKDRDFDMVFTSPPYYNLEVYSKEDLSSLGSYEEFMNMYEAIFKKCVEMLKDNSWLVVKVGDIRDKKTGVYYGFVADNIKLFQKLGLYYYNDCVLTLPISTASLRARGNFRTRKLVRTHQNVLIFYKGNPKNIKDYYPEIDFSTLSGVI